MPRPLKNTLPPLSQKDEDIGKNVAKFRKRKRLTQVQLATRIGIKQTLISEYETGRVRLNADMIIRLSQTLGVSSDAILGLSSQSDQISPFSVKIGQRMRMIESLHPFDQKKMLKIIDTVLKDLGIDPPKESS